MSQAQLAHELALRGLPFQQQTVLKVEKGSRPLKFEEAHAIAEVLGINSALLSDHTEDEERAAARAALRAAEVSIARCEQEIEHLQQERAHFERLRDEAAAKLLEPPADLLNPFHPSRSMQKFMATQQEAQRKLDELGRGGGG